jgi:hypothetical protein
VAGVEQLVVDAAIPLHKFQLIANRLSGLLPLDHPLPLQMGAHHVVEVAVGFGAACHGGRGRTAGLLVDDILCGLLNAFYARDVSLALLQTRQSILVPTHPRSGR